MDTVEASGLPFQRRPCRLTVGVRPTGATSVLLEQHEDWAVAERRYLSEESMAHIDQHLQEVTTTEQPELPAA